MAFHFLLAFALLNLAFRGSYATLTKEELHWISVFPHTPMPKFLQDILPGQSTLFKGEIDPGRKGVNEPKIGDNSEKVYKDEDSQINKGINDPQFGAYRHDYGYKGSKKKGSMVYDAPNEKGSESNDEGSPLNKGINDPIFFAYGYDYDYKKSKKESTVDNAPNKKGGESNDEDSPSNKGINDPVFGAYGYDYNYKSSKKEFMVDDASNEKDSESNDEDSPSNKGINDPVFGAYGYDYNYKSSKKEFTVDDAPNEKDSESNDEDSPSNKGINDPVFGAYGYDYNYKSFKKEFTVDDAPNEKGGESNDEDSPLNKGINDPVFGAYGYDYNYKSSKKESTVDDAPNNKGNRRHYGERSSHDDAAISQTIFFFPNLIRSGTKVNLPRLVQKRDMATFLPQQAAESMILTTDILPEILANLSLKAESRAATDLKVTLLNCERAEMKGEKKYCATSLESFVDSSVSMLGKNIRLLSHELGKDTKCPFFTIRKGVQNLGGNSIVCHKMKYPYAVYLCHAIEKTDVLVVPLVGIDGTKAKAVVACHKDTSAWSPNHGAFRILKAKPGDGPICHFLTRDTVVWMPN